jgi:hypothetical protein
MAPDAVPLVKTMEQRIDQGAKTMCSHESLTLRSHRPGAAAALTLLALLAAVPASAQSAAYSDYPETAGYDGSYTYVRTLEGSATLIQGDTGDRQALQTNQPVLVGDRVWVAPQSRAELVLSDRNLLRIDGGSEVAFEALAGSPDRQDRETVLRLPQGNIQLVLVEDFLGEGVPRIDSPNVTVYPRDLGSYRITADGSDWTEVVARGGSADVVTREGSVLVRAGEETIVEGDRQPRERVRQAGREDSLELWGRRLDQEARYAAAPYVDDSLRYESAALGRYGSWVSVEGRHAWRPRVAVEWRPYHDGRWSFSPLGLTWVSHEPWGWVPYHYGSWDYLPSYGWVWFPGYRFAPAWVYWSWTDHYAGWVPVGYYARHYSPFYGDHFGFRFGVYGWAGGSWDYYDRWSFCSTRFIGDRDQHHHVRDGGRFGRENRIAVPRQGLITTDTRGVTRTAVQRSEGIVEAIASRRGDSRELPDVTPFVARRQDLPDEVRSRILVDRRESAGSGRSVAVIAPDARPTRSVATRPAVVDRVGRTVSAAPERAPQRIDRPESAGGERQAPAVTPRPAVRPDSGRSAESWRTSAGTVRDAAPRAPQAVRPEAESPSRTEARPSPPARVDPRPAARPPADSSRSAAPTRIEPRPQERPRSEPPSNAREQSSSWRERAPVLPERSSIPRRVIEGVRSNSSGSTPFRSADPRVDPRVEARPDPRVAPRVETRPDPRMAPRIETRGEVRPSPPARVEPSRSYRPSSPPPARVESSPPSRSRSSSPPAQARSAPSSGSRAQAAPSRSPSRSSSSSSSGRATRGRERPPTE